MPAAIFVLGSLGFPKQRCTLQPISARRSSLDHGGCLQIHGYILPMYRQFSKSQLSTPALWVPSAPLMSTGRLSISGFRYYMSEQENISSDSKMFLVTDVAWQ